jgi:hypothetical protein
MVKSTFTYPQGDYQEKVWNKDVNTSRPLVASWHQNLASLLCRLLLARTISAASTKSELVQRKLGKLLTNRVYVACRKLSMDLCYQELKTLLVFCMNPVNGGSSGKAMV